MRIAITGTSGLVGKDVWETLKDQHELWGVGRKKPDFVPMPRWRTVDIVEAESVSKTIARINPDCLIHLAALSNPDECEADPVTAYKANAMGTRNLALACQRFDTEMLFMSTDLVFNGRKKSPYNETDEPDPVNHYGHTKFWAEKFVQSLLRKFYIVRTALVFGSRRPTFVDRVAHCALTQEPVPAATDIINCPTNSKDLSSAIAVLIDRRLYGTYHIANEGYCSRYELALFIAKSLGRKVHFIKKTTKDRIKFKAKRPGFIALDNLVWRLNEFPQMRSWQDAVADFLEEMPE